MSCREGLTITKGLDNTFVFTVKASGTTLPMEIESTDTFTARLSLIDPSQSGSAVLSKELVVSDAISGKVTLTITASETAGLVGDYGDKVDRYYLRPTYSMDIDCHTVNNGDFLVKVKEVYVD